MVPNSSQIEGKYGDRTEKGVISKRRVRLTTQGFSESPVAGKCLASCFPGKLIGFVYSCQRADKGVLICSERHWQIIEDEIDPGNNFYRNILHAPQISQLFQHHRQGNLCFQAGQGSAEAEVNAMSKGQMAIWLTLDIEAIWIRESRWIAVG